MKFKSNSILVAAVLIASSQIAIAQSDKKPAETKTMSRTAAPVAIVNGVAKLTPQNSKIEFIGIHADPDKPDPRLGGFEKFAGEIKLGADNSVESMQLMIDINSVWTQFGKLTGHLKNADFFESDKFGSAKFVSTKITSSDSGMQVTGNLTLHGVTQEISLPVKGKLDSSGIMLKSEFKLDRTLFGMDKMTSGVDKSVTVKFVVGQGTMKAKSLDAPANSSSSTNQSKPELTLVKLNAPNMT